MAFGFEDNVSCDWVDDLGFFVCESGAVTGVAELAY